jgi:hypothetical protein
MDNGSIRYLHFIKKDMKKIVLIIVFALLSVWAFGQAKPQDIKVNRLWCNTMYLLTPLVGTSDSVLVEENGRIKYVLATNLSGASLWKLTGDKLEPKISTNYINTGSSYYIKGVNFIRYFDNPYFSIAVGDGAMSNDTIGSHNIAIGKNSLYSNTTGSYNISNGNYSLYSNTTGSKNIANGYQSLFNNTIGNDNIANGAASLFNNTEGYNNIANGYQSLFSNTTGYENIANGAASLFNNTTGSGNIAIGYKSGQYADTAANGLLWIGEGDYNNAIIYGNMLTDSLRLNASVVIKNTLISGGLINRDTVVTIADSTSQFAFPASSTGWAEIYIDSLGYVISFANTYWSINGAVTLINNGSNVVTTNTDDKHCIFDEGAYCALINRRASSYKYMIKFHYHL